MFLTLTFVSALFLAGETPSYPPLRPEFQPPSPTMQNIQEPNFGYWAFKVGFSLFAVVVLIYGIGRFVAPKLQKFSSQHNQKLRIVERLALGPKNTLFVIEVEGKEKLLIGTSEHSIQTLANLSSRTFSEVVDEQKSRRVG